MTCADVRRHLLASERPDHPGPDESRHLANCPACHAWLRRLVRLERQIPHLLVPGTAPPAALLERMQVPAPPPLIRAAPPPHAQRDRVREFGRQKLALACSLAASLALFAFAWWAWPPTSNEVVGQAGAKGSYADRRDTRLSPSRTPQERVRALTELAEEFLDAAREHGDDAVRVAELARDFDRLVRDDLLVVAREVPAGQRAAVLDPIARRFSETESRASRLAAAWAKNNADVARSLRQIAASAAEADKNLRQLSGV